METKNTGYLENLPVQNSIKTSAFHCLILLIAAVNCSLHAQLADEGRKRRSRTRLQSHKRGESMLHTGDTQERQQHMC